MHRLLLCLAVVTLMSCRELPSPPAHDHHGAGGHHEPHAPTGSPHAGLSEQVSLRGEATLVHLAHAGLVAGDDSPVAVLVTRRRDHAPVSQGTIVLELTGGEHPPERFEIDAAYAPGVFYPVLRPKHAGPRTLTVRIDAPSVRDAHTLASIVVHPTRVEADANASHAHPPEGAIAYPLEQQWRAPFGIAKAEARPVRPSFQAFGTLVRPQDADVVVRAPLKGKVSRVGALAVSHGTRVEAGATAFEVGGQPMAWPITGEVAEVKAAPGVWADEGDALARVIDPNRLELQVEVPEHYVGRLREVSGAWFKAPHTVGVFELGEDALVSIGADVDPIARSLPVRFRVGGVRAELFAGQAVQANLFYERARTTLVVPATAVVDDGGADVVYEQVASEQFMRRPVKLGVRDGDWVEVERGLVPGAWIVARGGNFVRLAALSTTSMGHGHAH